MNGRYKRLADGSVEPVQDLLEWASWYEDTNSRRVALVDISETVRVSTVFLGLDHGFGSGGPPVLWETMIFGGPLDQSQWRYSSEADALKGHEEAIRAARQAGNENN